MIRKLREQGAVAFWAAIAAWFLADRAAHGGAAGAVPVALILFAGGVSASLVLARLGVFEADSRPERVSARAARLGYLLVAAMGAVIAAAVMTPIELFVRAETGDPWPSLLLRCALHPVFAFVTSLAVASTRRRRNVGSGLAAGA